MSEIAGVGVEPTWGGLWVRRAPGAHARGIAKDWPACIKGRPEFRSDRRAGRSSKPDAAATVSLSCLAATLDLSLAADTHRVF